MKRIVWFLWIPFLLIACSQQLLQRNGANYSRNYLLPIESHDVTVTFHPGSRLLQVQDNMKINRKECKDSYSGAIIINKNAFLSSLFVENTGGTFREVASYGSDYFNNELTEEQWNRLSQNGLVYEVQLPPYEEGHDSIGLCVKYQMLLDDAPEGIRLTDDGLQLDGTVFWYPSCFKDQVPFNVRVVSPKKFAVTIPGYTGTEKPVESLLKETAFWIPIATDPISIIAND